MGTCLNHLPVLAVDLQAGLVGYASANNMDLIFGYDVHHGEVETRIWETTPSTTEGIHLTFVTKSTGIDITLANNNRNLVRYWRILIFKNSRLKNPGISKFSLNNKKLNKNVFLKITFIFNLYHNYVIIK